MYIYCCKPYKNANRIENEETKASRDEGGRLQRGPCQECEKKEGEKDARGLGNLKSSGNALSLDGVESEVAGRGGQGGAAEGIGVDAGSATVCWKSEVSKEGGEKGGRDVPSPSR